MSRLEFHRLPPDGRRIRQGARNKKAHTLPEIEEHFLKPDETEAQRKR
jgi:hypothetical protein